MRKRISEMMAADKASFLEAKTIACNDSEKRIIEEAFRHGD